MYEGVIQQVSKTNSTVKDVITRPNCALDRRTILCLKVPGFQRQVLKHVKTLTEQSKKSNNKKERKERPCCGIRLQFTKCTVWPPNRAYFLT